LHATYVIGECTNVYFFLKGYRAVETKDHSFVSCFVQCCTAKHHQGERDDGSKSKVGG